jgi:metal-responsive CopG/Arc/MetJ family transcriptional regulator
MHPELLAALDAEIERQPKPTRPEMVRRILSANLIDP